MRTLLMVESLPFPVKRRASGTLIGRARKYEQALVDAAHAARRQWRPRRRRPREQGATTAPGYRVSPNASCSVWITWLVTTSAVTASISYSPRFPTLPPWLIIELEDDTATFRSARLAENVTSMAIGLVSAALWTNGLGTTRSETAADLMPPSAFDESSHSRTEAS